MNKKQQYFLIAIGLIIFIFIIKIYGIINILIVLAWCSGIVSMIGLLICLCIVLFHHLPRFIWYGLLGSRYELVRYWLTLNNKHINKLLKLKPIGQIVIIDEIEYEILDVSVYYGTKTVYYQVKQLSNGFIYHFTETKLK